MEFSESRFWHRIWDDIENEKWAIINQRLHQRIEQGTALDQHAGRAGIMVCDDDLARRYQRLCRVQNHVGLHGCAAHDREHGMKRAVCYRVILAKFAKTP